MKYSLCFNFLPFCARFYVFWCPLLEELAKQNLFTTHSSLICLSDQTLFVYARGSNRGSQALKALRLFRIVLTASQHAGRTGIRSRSPLCFCFWRAPVIWRVSDVWTTSFLPYNGRDFDRQVLCVSKLNKYWISKFYIIFIGYRFRCAPYSLSLVMK